MYQKSAKAGSQSVLSGAGGDEELPRGEGEEDRGGGDTRDIQPDCSNGRQPDKVGWGPVSHEPFHLFFLLFLLLGLWV